MSDIARPVISQASQLGYTPSGTGAVHTTVADELNRTVTAERFGAYADDTTDCVLPIQRALAHLDSIGGGVLQFGSGTYWFAVSGSGASNYIKATSAESKVVKIPSNVTIRGNGRTRFAWDFCGVPLIAFINVTDSSIEDVEIIYSGTNVYVAGRNGRLGWGDPADQTQTKNDAAGYEWSCQIAIMGSSRIKIKNVRIDPATSANRIDTGILLRGGDDWTVRTGNKIENCVVNGCRFTVGFGEQDGLVINGLTAETYHNAPWTDSATSTPPGHIVYGFAPYDTSKTASISTRVSLTNIRDYGVRVAGNSTETRFWPDGHALSIKHATDTVAENVFSRRAEGLLNITAVKRCRFTSLDYVSTEVVASAYAAGIIACVEPNVSFTGDDAKSYDNVIGKIRVYRSGWDTPLVYLDSPDGNYGERFRISDAELIRDNQSGWTTVPIRLAVKYSRISDTRLFDLTGTQSPVIVEYVGDADYNSVEIDYSHPSATPGNSAKASRSTGGDGGVAEYNQTTIRQRGDSRSNPETDAVLSNTNELCTPPYFKTFWVGLGVTASPSRQIRTRGRGVYLCTFNLSATPGARLCSYYVTVGAQGVAEQVVKITESELTSGGTPPGAFSVSVDSAGTITASSTATSATWLLTVGIVRLLSFT